MIDDKELFESICNGNLKEKLSELIRKMTTKDEERKSAEINRIVSRMMRERMDSDDFEDILSELTKIYAKEYRHYYSSISGLIYSERRNSNNPEMLLDLLGTNNTEFHGYVVKKFENKKESEMEEKILSKCNKLYDHIDLEVVRLREYDTQIKEAVQKIDIKINEFNTKSEMKNKELADDARKMKNEYVSILGIFASIVLAFVGGLTFSTSVLSNIGNASVYRVIVVACIVGMTFSFIIWLLFHFVERFVTKKDDKKTKISWPIILVEILFIIIIVITSLSFKFKWFEEKSTDANANITIEKALINESCQAWEI